MKEIITTSFKKLISDRYLLVLLSFIILLTIIFAINLGLSIQPNERQLISHYTAFGVTHFYYEQWFYLLVFVFFGIFMMFINIIIAIKLLLVKGHSFAIMYGWFSFGIIIFSWVMALRVLNLQALL